MKKRSVMALLLAAALLLCACVPQQGQQAASDGQSSDDTQENIDTSNQGSVDTSDSANNVHQITGYEATALTWTDTDGGILHFSNPYFVGSYFEYRETEGSAYWTSAEKDTLCIEFTEDSSKGDGNIAGPHIRFTVDLLNQEVLDVAYKDRDGNTVYLFPEYMVPMALRLAQIMDNAESGITQKPEIIRDTILALPDGAAPLTEQELAQINTGWFSSTSAEPPYAFANSFLSCFYRSPDEIGLKEVFYNGYEGTTQDLSEAERAAVEVLCPMPLDVHRTYRSVMDDVLKTYTGHGLADIQQIGLDAFIYLEEYDAYYMVRSDTNWASRTMLEGYRTEDGQLVLAYEDSGHSLLTGCQYTVVTLQSADAGESFNGYWFVSNLPLVQ